LINAYGVSVFGDYVTQCYNLANTFAQLIMDEDGMELAVFPDSNIVCFRVVKEDETATDECNIMVRNNILREGKFYIVQTKLNGRVYLRVSLMNPFTNADDLRELLDTIKKIA
nr:pyridoxal-dependent decarboxylase [Saprospiraceae bacterium]